MRPFTIILVLALLLSGRFTLQAQPVQSYNTLTGNILAAESRKPLPAAVLEIVELGVRTATNEAGEYRLRVPASAARQVTLRATYVGRQDVEVPIKLVADAETRRDLQLPLRSLALADVQVNATRSGQQVSNSTITLGREAIEQTQAYSLGDVLQLLPGKVLLNTNLQGAQAITLRSAPVVTRGTDQTAAFSQNNAFGTAIIVDGATWGNNGNLQADDPGRRGVIGSFSVPDNSRGGDYASGSYAGSSLDLKQIPANNIESVEVIQGVPSARYGDLSSGAIIVNRQAGRTPYRVSTRTQSGTTELTASKGIGLANGNALNVSGTFVNSNPEPQFKTKAFNRLTLGTIYTAQFGPARRHRNSLAFDAHSTLDDARTDPDDQDTRRTYSRDQRLALSNRGTLNLLRPWSEYVSYQFGASYSYQDTYHYRFENQQVKPVSDAMTTGISRGSFTPGVYDVEQRIIGRPLNLYARADNTLFWATGAWSHTLTGGVSVSYDRNLGAGRLFNPLRPITSVQANVDGKGTRPFDFSSVPGMVQAGAFLENQVVRQWGPRRLVANLGLRYDNQNGFSTLAPRLNAKLFLSEALQLNAAYGVSAKAPGLIHRYPGLLYFESPLLVSFNGRENESLYLVHTQVVNPANPNLRPARARTLEVGMNVRSRRGYALSVTAYRKQDEDGFSVNQRRLQLELPEYRLASPVPGQPPTAEPTGQQRVYSYNYGVVENNLRTTNYGLELLVRTPKLRALQTSFDLSTAYTNSYFLSAGRLTYTRKDPLSAEFRDIEQVVYQQADRNGQSALSTVSSTTHLSRLGLVVTLRGQLFWGSWSSRREPFEYAQGFYRPSGQYVAVSRAEQQNGAYQNLRNPIDQEEERQPFVYGNLHLRLAKELGKLARLSFFANNFLNLRPEQFNRDTQVLTVYNQNPTFGSELVLTF
ncbi:TonB-dependent receptor [Hymenobacter terrenus]|uniref:TonB-dependent receptor n=1 Tax=Hymenobacter terrenus TaxID=1629124 RepID=UPI000619C796|nr:TonB-dependent receptor plug domain-containing protein [Hymenobacter terrenus]